MRKIIINESQARMLMEEIDRNDSIQKLIFCEPSDIEFEVSDEVPAGIPVSRGLFRLTPVIDGKEIGGEYVNFLAEEVKVNGHDIMYQLHINVNEELRRLGIAYKLYMAFILQGYPVCSLFTNRVNAFYSEKGKTRAIDNAIDGLWQKIENTPDIAIEDLLDADGNKIGIMAWHK